jgi:hypothetical protein
MIARPFYLGLLAAWEAERQAEVLRTIELHLADQRFEQAHRTIASYELEIAERQLPLESVGVAPQVAAALIRAGVETVQQLRDCDDELLASLRGVSGEMVAKLKAIRQQLLEQ